ncbi:MAG: hypothetical protein LH606_20340, partial [Cytophagaceae bacterium]|nr:hypothetical protein [Cytophagaceae bacterium]
ETRRAKFEALIQRIKREDYEEAYRFDNFNLFVAPDATDVVSQLLRYAQYLELSDVLHEVYGLTYREKPFYQVFQPDELACNRFLLNHQKEKLSQVIQNDFIQHLQNQPGLSRDVEKELKNLNGSLRDDFDRLRNYAKEAPDNIESDLAQFIFDWKIEPHLERCRQKADVKGLYNHIIWYFALDGQLNPNSAICLQNYVYMVAYERREAPLLSLGSQESIADFSKEAFKEFVNVGLSSVPFGVGSLLGLPFGPAGVIVSGFVTRVSINHILKYMRQSRYQSGLGSEHYERFRQAFNEHVILEILKNKTDEFLRSETRKQLVEWQDRFRDFL